MKKTSLNIIIALIVLIFCSAMFESCASIGTCGLTRTQGKIKAKEFHRMVKM